MPKRLVILGSTGSIGTSTLDVVSRFPEQFTVAALTAGRNIQRLAEQIRAFHPELVAVRDEQGAADLRRLLPPALSVEIHHGEDGFRRAASQVPADMVVAAMAGAAGLMPTLAATTMSAGTWLAARRNPSSPWQIFTESAGGRSRRRSAAPCSSRTATNSG